jgi:fluoride exporter
VEGAVPIEPHPPGDGLPVDPDLAVAGAVAGRGAGSPRRAEPAVLAAIALGAALGAPARYGIAQLIHVAPDTFPWATFWTNVSGSAALGLFLALIVGRFPPSRYVRAFVATGFLGAYTTYSTFAVETDVLVKNGRAGTAVAYAAASLLAGFVAAWLGIMAGRAVARPAGRGGTDLSRSPA